MKTRFSILRWFALAVTLNSVWLFIEVFGKPNIQNQNDYNNLFERADSLSYKGQYSEAKSYLIKAIDLTGDDSLTLGEAYNNVGALYKINSQYDSAKYYYRHLISVSKSILLQHRISCYTNLSTIDEHEKNYVEVISLKKNALAIDRVIKDNYGMMTSYRTIADYYIRAEDFSTGLLYLDSASWICDSTWIVDLYGIENLKYISYEGLKNYQLALLHYKKSIEYRDSLNSIQKRKNIAQFLAKVETDKKVQQIELLNKTNQLKSKRIHTQWIILLGLILLIMSGAIISFQIIRNKNHKLKQMSLELRNYLLEYQGTEDSLNEKKADTNNHLKILKDHFGLTRREAEIMEMISQGLTNEELGKKLFVSKNTIKYHIKNIYIKLDVRNRVQALQKTTTSYPLS